MPSATRTCRTSCQAASVGASPSLARSSTNPTLILADEPTGNLDSVNAEAILDLLFEIKRARGATLVMVTHELSYAARCARPIRIKDGKVNEQRAKRSRQEAV